MIEIEGEYIGTISVLANANRPGGAGSEAAIIPCSRFASEESPEAQRGKVVATPSAVGRLHLK
jgi:hypothetical protein